MSKINTLRKQLHGKSFEYDSEKYNFKQVLEELFGCKTEDLHLHLGDFQRFKRNNDQSTLAHRIFYSNYNDKIKDLYDEFMIDVISNIIDPVEAYYQLIPTFRIGLPGNTFVGEFHKDSDYNHQSYELNFNLGISNYVGEAALRTQKTEDSEEYMLLECPYGTIFSFDHIDCLHGSNPNPMNSTMVSFDFRLAVKDLYYDSDAGSVNMGSKFQPGSYFSSSALNS